MDIGFTYFTDGSDLELLLTDLRCPNSAAAIRDFEAYGVAKFAVWTRCRCPGAATFQSFTVRPRPGGAPLASLERTTSG